MRGVSNIWFYLVNFEKWDRQRDKHMMKILRYRDPSDPIRKELES